MDIKIPFEKEIDFNNNISEVTKISLEQDYTVSEDKILGNFYVSGEYKVHEVSINTEEFKYTLPFTVELVSNIDKDSLEFNIDDFTYEIKDNTKLLVKIEYSVKGVVKEDEWVRVDDNDIKEELEYIDDFIDNKKEDREEEKVIENLDNKEDEYVTYRIHYVSYGETIENISNTYNIPVSIIMEYNNIDTINYKDKIILPVIDE